MVVLVRIGEGEPFLDLLGYVKEKSILVFPIHLGLATDAEPKHVSRRLILSRGLGSPHRLLPFWVHYVYLRRRRVSVNFHIFLIFLVGKNEPTLIDFLLYPFLKGEAFACSVAPELVPLAVLPPPELLIGRDRTPSWSLIRPSLYNRSNI